MDLLRQVLIRGPTYSINLPQTLGRINLKLTYKINYDQTKIIHPAIILIK